MTSPLKPLEKFIPNPKLKLREQLGEVMRFKHFSHRTESAYWCWIRGFIFFHQKRHPREMGAAEVQAYLSHLASERDVAPATQNQALNAIVFLYREVCRFKHLLPRTEESYWGWMRRFLIFHKQGEQWRHPMKGEGENAGRVADSPPARNPDPERCSWNWSTPLQRRDAEDAEMRGEATGE